VIDGHNDVTSWMLDYGFDLGMDGAADGKRAAALYWVLGWLLPKPSGDELRTHTDLRRLRAGGVDAQFFSIFPHSDYAETPGASRQRALDMIDALLAQIRGTPTGSSSRAARRTSGASPRAAASPR
jgi:microsomal dipeptidase-like Zn-dependent dipeptidase